MKQKMKHFQKATEKIEFPSIHWLGLLRRTKERKRVPETVLRQKEDKSEKTKEKQTNEKKKRLNRKEDR
jgi:hypothetical protein